MKHKVKKHCKNFLYILGIFFLIFNFLFFLNKEFRFNIAVRLIVLANVNPIHERYYDVNIWDDNIHITKKIHTYYEDKNKFIVYERDKRFERMKIALQTSLDINEAIYKLQRSEFWCNSIRAVYIDSDTYVKGGLTTLSVGTGHGSYEINEDTDYSYEEKWVIVRDYNNSELRDEFEKIVLKYDGYSFQKE